MNFAGVVVERESKWWKEAWESLGARSPADRDREARHPDSGESWQYMGTWFRVLRHYGGGTFGPPAGTWEHQFRHRTHPTTGERVIFNAPASVAFAKAHKPEPRGW